MQVKLTQQAQDIVEAVGRGESIAVSAVAGGGKTTSLVASLQTPKPGTLALAFNKKTATELATRLPTTVTSKTLNAIGHGAWVKHIGRQPKLDAQKLWKLWNDYPLNKQLHKEAPDIISMVKIARNHGLKPGILNVGPLDINLWLDLCDDISKPDELLPHATALFQKSCQQAFEGLIDFDDQIYCPVTFSSPFTKFNCIAVDEAQDLSIPQHEMVKRSLAPNGQLIVIGDPNQAIYGFRCHPLDLAATIWG